MRWRHPCTRPIAARVSPWLRPKPYYDGYMPASPATHPQAALPSAALTALAPDLWSVQHQLSVQGLPVRTRMTVAHLPGNRLWLHSPIAPSPALCHALNALGQVAWVVAPSRMHHLFAGQWLQHYPSATLWGAPGLAEKRPDLSQLHTLPNTIALPPTQAVTQSAPALPADWYTAFAMQLFGGIPLLNETIWLHRASGSLIFTDVLQYYPQDLSLSAQLFNSLNGTRSHLAMPRAIRFAIRDKAAARASAQTIAAWPVQRIVLAHDTVIDTDAADQLQAAWAFLLG